MSWRPEVDEIERRKRLARELGGAEAIERQHASGRLTIRERIDRLVDPGSFHETGPQAGFAEVGEDGATTSFEPANYVLGVGRIDGRPCVVGGEDFTQRGGSPSTAGFRKSVYAEEMACRLRLPLVRFLEGGGGSVRGSSKRSAPAAAGDPVYATHRFVSIARALRTAPVVSAGLGAVAGLPAARLAASHLAIMTRANSQVLIGGPALVERALGEKKTKEELGGAQVHGKSGVVDLVVEAEDDVFGAIRRFLSYLPTRVGELAPRATPDWWTIGRDAPKKICSRSCRAIAAVSTTCAGCSRLVFDLGSLYEMSRFYGRSQITALARLDGWPVGVFANDPSVQGGAMGAEDAQKVRRFLQLCQTFHLPILSFVDEPGFMIGSQAEAAGTIRYGVEAICTAVETTVPWATVHVRKAYGVASAAHFGPGGHVLAWPSAESGPLPLEGGIAVAFKREIAAAPDPDAKRRELEETFAKARSPFPRAESFSVHDLIDPRDTRPELCRWLELARPQVEREARRRSLDRND